MAIKSQLKDRKTGTPMYPVTLLECILDAGIPIEAITSNDNDGTYFEPDKCYYIEGVVNQLSAKIQYDATKFDPTKVHAIEVFLMTGDNPSISFGASNHAIRYFEGFSLEPNTTYELNFMFNGNTWVAAYAVVE